MLETMVQFVLGDHHERGVFSSPLSPMGYKRLLSRTRGPYPTKDGHIAIVVYSDQHWRAFTALVGQDGLTDRDPRFKTLEMRTQHAVDMGIFSPSICRRKPRVNGCPRCKRPTFPALQSTRSTICWKTRTWKRWAIFRTWIIPPKAA